MKTKITFCVAMIVNLVAFQAAAQAPIIQWERTAGGTNEENFGYFPSRNVVEIPGGGYIVGGSSYSPVSYEVSQPSKGKYDYWVVRYGANGTILWDKRFGGEEDDFLNTIVRKPGGGYLLVGSSFSGASGDKTAANYGNCLSCGGGSDIWIVEIDDNGNKISDRSDGGVGGDRAYVMRNTRDGGYILAASTFTTGLGGGTKNVADHGGWDVYLIKYSANLSVQWQRALGGSGHELEADIIETAEGNYCVASYTESGIDGDVTQASKGGPDAWILLIDTLGTKLWDARFGGNSLDNAKAVVQADDGGFVFTGDTRSDISGDVTKGPVCGSTGQDLDYWVVKITNTGTIEWQNRFGTSVHDQVRQIVKYKWDLNNDGLYVLGGQSGGDASNYCDNTNPHGGSDYFLVGINDLGEKQWTKAYGGNSLEVFSSFEATSDGGFIMTGYSISPISADKTEICRGENDLWTVKLICESPPTWYRDLDNDGFGDVNTAVVACKQPDDDYITTGGDCNDNNIGIHPGAPELCDGIDNDCDGQVDEDKPAKPTITANHSTNNLCPGKTVMLTSSVASAYLWSTGATTQNIIVSTAGSYTVTAIISALGCSNTSNPRVVSYQTCAPPTGLAVSNIMSTSANIHWNPVACAIGYQYQYRKKGTSPWTTGVLTLTNKTLAGLAPQTIYQWRVRSGCKITPDTIGSIYTTISTFTTAANFGGAKTTDAALKTEVSCNAKIYPNPSTGQIIVLYNGSSIGNIEIKVIDVMGKQVFLKTETAMKGVNTYHLNLSLIASGVYYLEMINNNEKTRLKFVIDK